MRFDGVSEIGEWLAGSGGLSEALLHELALARFGYSIRAVFQVIADLDGAVLQEPRQVVVDLDGVDRLELRGGLTPRMVEHPEEINWGLSEVALVRVMAVDGGVRFEVLWEGDRRIEVRCHKISLTAPGAPT
jgi:hypothetical protein